MSTNPVVVQQPSLEDKILAAVQQSEQVIGLFSPTIAQVAAAGVQMEPVISGFAQLIIGIFKHHTAS